jgi:glutathione S-transferase
MIRLHVFPQAWGINPSPFCLKVETYCRLANIPFETVSGLPVGAPRGKLPFIDHNGQRIPDSGWIIAHLKQQYGDPLDAGLTPAQHAAGHVLRRTCEESLYFCLVYARWLDPAGWKVIKPIFFNTLPPVARDAIAMLARRGVRTALKGQGYGRHSPGELYALGAADLAAIATLLAAQDFAVGAQPSSYDASLYGVLANILTAPIETPLAAEARRHATLPAYLARMREALAANAHHPPSPLS